MTGCIARGLLATAAWAVLKQVRPSPSGPAEFHLTGQVEAGQCHGRMLNPVIQALLILQDRDLKRLGLEAQLKQVPLDVARVEQKIAAEKAAIDAARAEWRDLESKKKLIETEIGSAETKAAQYRTQQLSIRKNDEYQAMGHQIETLQNQIAELEGKELEIMYAIDEAKKKFAAAEAELKAHIQGHEERIRVLKEREASLSAELKSAQNDVSAARSVVEPLRLRVYDRIAARNMPVVVPVHAAKCGGCHLKVSSEVESAARGKGVEPTAALPTCDQCGRIVYFDA
jgi:predicted  nucleic acid-binding Zn-ribbon protein